MAGRVISKANAAHVQALHDTTTKLGAQCGSAAKRLALKAAGGDVSVFDLIERIRDAMMRAVSISEAQDIESYPHLEDIYPDAMTCIIEIGDVYWQASYLVDSAGEVTLQARNAWQQVEEVWQPVSGTMKSGALSAGADGAAVYATIKALGERTLELRVAWGRDGQGEQFTPATDFDTANFPSPPVLYYHGFKADNKPAARPIVIGKTIARETRADGHYLTAKLNDTLEAGKVWDAALKGVAAVSPGTIGHLIRKTPDATLTYWPIAEISAWEWDGSRARKQAHPRSLAFPVLKSLYLEAGLAVPQILNDTPTEAPGDGAGSAQHIDPHTAGQVIASEVARAVQHIIRSDR